ncbi:MAG: alpha/beta hydrolase [Pseudomonadota bacterium]
MPKDLIPAVDAERVVIRSDGRDLSYYVAGDGDPVLLIHSINAAASVYEVKPVFDALATRYRVFAPDLPGFGFSDRSDRDYTIDVYTTAVRDMLQVIGQGPGVHVLGLSLSSEFVARQANRTPDAFRSLALVTPTGFNRGSDSLRATEGATRENAIAAGLAGIPGFRAGLFKLLVRPGTVRFFLKRTFGSDNVDESLARYCTLTASQPGALYAPLAFLSGRLFARDIRQVYESLLMPVWLAHGTRGDFRDFSETGWTQQRSNWTVTSFDTGAIPYFEQHERFMNAYVEFLDGVD